MTKKKRVRTDKRRSISVKGITHQRLKEYCDAQGKSVSGYLEEIVAEKLDAAGVPVPTELRPSKPRGSKGSESGPLKTTEIDAIADEYFTF